MKLTVSRQREVKRRLCESRKEEKGNSKHKDWVSVGRKKRDT